MSKFSDLINAGLLLTLLFAAPLQAQTYLREGSAGKVNWVGGGTNTEEIDMLKAQEGKFSLKLMFTLTEGNYLAGVNVAVRDASGTTVMQQSDTGPVLLLNLPHGAFTVTATSDGRSQTRNVLVGDRLRTEYLRWPAEKGKDFTPTATGSTPSAPGK